MCKLTSYPLICEHGSADIGAGILEADIGQLDEGHVTPLWEGGEGRDAGLCRHTQAVPGPLYPAVSVSDHRMTGFAKTWLERE